MVMPQTHWHCSQKFCRDISWHHSIFGAIHDISAIMELGVQLKLFANDFLFYYSTGWNKEDQVEINSSLQPHWSNGAKNGIWKLILLNRDTHITTKKCRISFSYTVNRQVLHKYDLIWISKINHKAMFILECTHYQCLFKGIREATFPVQKN